ncbi:cytochrome c oxidase subunit IV, partial [Cystobasidium minutum MCA 4210]|uniref:cytochrome c oxidase subunit IV n=1 Tax=Cystobasidium minutum MCA 4210 TaxID=1397322 RepID=UPI0034CD26C0
SSTVANTLAILYQIEAAWANLPRNEQERIFTELQELQKKDWKELSLDEKKAAYYISYGAHGPRAPIVPPNTNGKVFLGVVGSILTAFGVFALVRMNSQETPKTMSKEWKDAQTEMAREQKMDP